MFDCDDAMTFDISVGLYFMVGRASIVDVMRITGWFACI